MRDQKSTRMLKNRKREEKETAMSLIFSDDILLIAGSINRKA